ncbi:MAG: A24 family peptidase [Butyrivibrio sp.]|nr:A24 family peptidase [Butyrivibrio sp.]
MDFKYDRIPNALIAIGLCAGSLFRFMDGGLPGIADAAVVILISFCLLYPIYRLGGLGGGDVKLFLMTGSFFTAHMQFRIMIYSFITGALISILKIISEKNFRERMKYLCSYLFDVMYTGQWKLYGENLKWDSNEDKRNKIHFALPIYFGVMLGLGGML